MTRERARQEWDKAIEAYKAAINRALDGHRVDHKELHTLRAYSALWGRIWSDVSYWPKDSVKCPVKFN